MSIKYLLTTIVTATFALVGMSHSVQAEDTEIFFTDSRPSAPNVLFMLDTSGSMEETLGNQTRMEILRGALNQVLSRDYTALNVGIMDFNKTRGGGIDFPVVDINADAHDIDSDIPVDSYSVSELLKRFVNNYRPDGLTPMGDAFYRASSYFRGDPILYTDGWGKPHTWNVRKDRYEGGHTYSDHASSIKDARWVVSDQYRVVERSCSETLPASNKESCKYWRFNELGYTCSTAGSYQPRYCVTEKETCVGSGNKECRWKEYKTEELGDSDPEPDYGGGYRTTCYPASSNEGACIGKEKFYSQGFNSDNATYKSPINDLCQKNYFVLLSDGEPTSMVLRDKIAELVRPVSHEGDWSYHNCEDISHLGRDVSEYGRCLPDLTKYMSTSNQVPGLLGNQTVTTYSIGFAIDGNQELQDFLKLLADEDHGNGAYFDANSAEELVDIFQDIIDSVTTGARGFVAPTVSVDKDNRLTTSEYVYLPTFTPKSRPGWEGDIIRYRISESGFDEANSVSLAGELTTTRNIYTYTGSNLNLTDSSNRVKEDNNDLTLEMLGVANSSERSDVLRWARGVDKDGKALKHMGSSLHTKPAIVSYTNGKNILYAATNDGYLHAFDVSNTDEKPSEVFAFIPQDLLPDLKVLYNNVSADSKVYGLDGDITVWQQSDGTVTLYFGMRRGGRNYYALDVTDPDAPKFKWVINGGSGNFDELGQSWSTPQLTQVKHNETEKMALIFGGGYDTNQDNTSKAVRNDDAMGRAVFIVDAGTGELLWSVGPSGSGYKLELAGLKNSIPSNIRSVDLNSNGLADRLYFGDTGGRVWRIDLDESDITASTGYQLADFNDGTAEGNRRIYYAPSIAFSRDRRLMITVGSGYRAHPLATGVQDRFYAFEDVDVAVGKPSSTATIITESHLSDVTNESETGSDETVGWYFNLSENEKVLAGSLIFNSNVTFTTYTPNFGESGNNICSLAGASAKAYVVRLRDGSSALDSSNGTNRSIDLEIDSIPGAPYVVFNNPSHGGEPTADMYVEKQKIGNIQQVTERLFWRKEN